MAYDKAKWHYTDDFPKDLDEEQIYVHTGFYIGWIIDKGFYSEEFEKFSKNDIEKFRRKEITAPKLYENQGGVLSHDELNEEGRLFSSYYYENLYFDDYRTLFIKGGLFKRKLPSDYHVKNTWDNYKLISAKIDERFKEWSNFSTDKKLSFRKSFDFINHGINDNSRAIKEYFNEKFGDTIKSEGFKYIKSKEIYSKNEKDCKKLFGIHVSFRGGCGYTIFPYFGIINKRIEKLYKNYSKDFEYFSDESATIIFGEHKIIQDNPNWIEDWSPQGDESKVDSILARVIKFYESVGREFYNSSNKSEKIFELLLNNQSQEIGHPYLPIKVFERIAKGLIAAALSKTDSIDKLITGIKPFLYEHYSQGDWAYDSDAKELFERISNDILNGKIE